MSAGKITIVVEAGRLVGTHVAAAAINRAEGKGPVARVVAGPGQTLRETEVDFEVPKAFKSAAAVKEFHDRVRRAAGVE